ncbi:MAG: sigma-54-dependent Fis family transcriptional regulator [Alphaproteobacteria bacterium]|nr:sigma-54-dependent Fis family transcriptional regulator [Alphaproteobacteria bacterium]
MSTRPKILLVEDTVPLAHTYQEYLRQQPYDITHVETGTEGLKEIAGGSPDMLLLDLELPDMNGMEILQHLQENEIPIPVVVITAHGSIGIAVSAMQAGAKDFLVKPFSADRLRVTVANTIEAAQLAGIIAEYREKIDRDSFGNFVGRSLAMQNLYRILESAAPSDATVFLTGESGTGKELCAQAIHQYSRRSRGQLVAINCGAIPDELMESELFGHVRGAFTGATSDRVGAVEAADGGTLFLDEIGEMKLDLQVKLLRFLQSQEFMRVGETKSRRVNTRIVCATNRDPQQDVRDGKFREDLFYRLHVVPVAVPPLRERDDDPLILAEHFLADYAKQERKNFDGFSRDAAAAIVAYDWPGNVRELQNVIRNIVVMNEGGEIGVAALPPQIATLAPGGVASGDTTTGENTAVTAAPPAGPVSELPRAPDDIRPLEDIERDAIEHAIEICDGNIRMAATYLEVSPATIYRKRAKWEESDTA